MSGLAIPATEFAERRQRACAQAQDRGLDALIVWSRGSASVDFYGDVMYLTNHTSPFPMQPDNLPTWAGRGHSVLIMPIGGRPVLVVDSYDYRGDLATVEDVRIGLNVPELVASVLLELKLSDATLGLVGRNSMLLAHYQMICASLGKPPRLIACDDILESLRLIKSDAELGLIRAAAAVGVEAMRGMIDAVRPGCTEADVASEGWRIVARNGGILYDTAIASGPNAERFQWARMPSWDQSRSLERGDLIHIDMYGPMCAGYWSDVARSTVVGGRASSSQEALLNAAVELVEAVVSAVRPGITFGEIWEVGNNWRNEHDFPAAPDEGSGCLVGLDADFPAFGHTIGMGLESSLLQEGSTTRLHPNMVLAVETLLTRAGVGGANHEENVIVTDGGSERLTTALPARAW